MAFRLTYQAIISWVGPGLGPMAGNLSTSPGLSPPGGAQILSFFVSNPEPTTNTFLAADITTLLAAMSTDLSTQMNASIQRVQGFATGTD